MYRRSSPLATLNGFTQNADLLEEAAAALGRQGEKEAEYQALVDDGLSAYEAAGTVWPEPHQLDSREFALAVARRMNPAKEPYEGVINVVREVLYYAKTELEEGK